MKKIRIGVGAGGCPYERLEPTLDLIERGNLDYLIFETLSERGIIDMHKIKRSNPEKGYNPMLKIRMEKMLKKAKEKNIKIISNMGGANTPAAIREIKRIAEEQEIHGLKIAMVYGDDITESIKQYDDVPLWDRKDKKLGDLEEIISANVYFGADGIVEALDMGADIVITGRVVDAALFVGPIRHEFGFKNEETEKMGQAILLGHLLECNAQVTGGYYLDPGYKDIENMAEIGFPIAEMDETGSFFITKLENSGGTVNVDVCKEQLLYEIKNPAEYIIPDGIADFSHVKFEQIEKDKVLATGANIKGIPDTYKVNVGYLGGYIGVGENSYGGLNSLNRARAVAEAIVKRWDIIGIKPQEYRVDYIGYNSLYGDKIAQVMSDGNCPEVRLRIAVRTDNEEDAILLIREVQCLYINGAAGSAGITSNVQRVVGVENIIIPRADVEYGVKMEVIE